MTNMKRAALLGLAASALGAGQASAITVTGTVPNNFVRECSNFSGRCTGYVHIVEAVLDLVNRKPGG